MGMRVELTSDDYKRIISGPILEEYGCCVCSDTADDFGRWLHERYGVVIYCLDCDQHEMLWNVYRGGIWTMNGWLYEQYGVGYSYLADGVEVVVGRSEDITWFLLNL